MKRPLLTSAASEDFCAYLTHHCFYPHPTKSGRRVIMPTWPLIFVDTACSALVEDGEDLLLIALVEKIFSFAGAR